MIRSHMRSGRAEIRQAREAHAKEDPSMRPSLTALALAAALSLPAAAEEVRNPLQDGETWAALKSDLFGAREIRDGSAFLTLDAPYRAHDAGMVPVELDEAPEAGMEIVRLTLVIDENPAPVAAEFEFGPAMPDVALATRVRVNAYSSVRAIAETAGGELYMVGRYVKASGGCAAPAMKDAEAAMAQLGKMKLRLYDAAAEAEPARPATREAQVMLRHPNYSGLQMNQLTQLFIPAHFVHDMEVSVGERLAFRMTGGISISEDPAIRFRFVPDGAESIAVRAEDTEGEMFERSFPVEGGRAS